MIWTNWGMIDKSTDTRYMMDDYGNAVPVPFCVPLWFFSGEG